MNVIQKQIILSARLRGFHLITKEIEDQLPELSNIDAGIAFINIQHTSASLTLNESADPEVRKDMESFFNNMIPDSTSYFEHKYEGDDDMPAHIKSAMLGTSITIPITKGKFNLGTWQGIYLCEHRNLGGKRKLVITLMG